MGGVQKPYTPPSSLFSECCARSFLQSRASFRVFPRGCQFLDPILSIQAFQRLVEGLQWAACACGLLEGPPSSVRPDSTPALSELAEAGGWSHGVFEATATFTCQNW